MNSIEEKLIKDIGKIRSDLECLYRDYERAIYDYTRNLIKAEIKRLELGIELLEENLKDMEG